MIVLAAFVVTFVMVMCVLALMAGIFVRDVVEAISGVRVK